jgi:trans-aconitate methyltransferase
MNTENRGKDFVTQFPFSPVTAVKSILGHPAVYRAWQAPFVRQKLAPFQKRVDLIRVPRVIDLGCGPGTNARIFSPAQYVGVDISAEYIEYARRHYPHQFEVWDITKPGPELGTFDLGFVNSVFHHLSDEEANHVLGSLSGHLNPDASVHVIDLVLPEQPSLARTLARLDRGEHPRHIEHWRELLDLHLAIELCETFFIGIAGVRMWQMMYVTGSVRR